MALKGNVETISLVEIFDYLHGSGHSGTLKVSNNETVKVIHFYNGTLYFPERDQKSGYRIGDLLVRNRDLTSDQLQAGLRIQKESGGLLGEVLAAEGFITQDDVRRVLSMQYQEEIYDLFLWKHAYFEFHKDVLPEGFSAEVEDNRALSFHPPSIVMEATRRTDEWKRMQAAIPSLKTIYREAEGRSEDIDKVLTKNRIDPDIVRFDGALTLEMVFDKWRLTNFESHGVVFALIAEKLIESIPGKAIRNGVKQALQTKNVARALRFYEAAIETRKFVDASVELDPYIFGEHGIRGCKGEISTTFRTSGKRALYALVAGLKASATGSFKIVEADNERIVTLTDTYLGLETSGANLTPNAIHYVARRGLMTAEQIEETRRIRDETRRPMHTVLLEGGYITQEDWIRVLTDKMVDEIYDVFFWNKPYVEFHNRQLKQTSRQERKLRLKMPFSVPGFLDELRAELDRVTSFLEQIPSVRTVFKTTGKALSEERQQIESLFNGRRSIVDVLEVVRGVRQDLLHFVHRALEAERIRHLTPQEYVGMLDAALEEERFRDAQILCRSAIDSGVEPKAFQKKLEAARYAEEETVQTMLEGDFESFSLAEILQSLHRRQHSGTLKVSDGKRFKTIYFYQGDVYLLQKEEETSKFAGAFLDEDTLEAVEETFGGDLTAKGLVTEDEISDADAIQIKEEIWDMFLWEKARFVFTRNLLPPEFFNPTERVTRLLLRTESFLLEAVRRIYDWEELRERLPEANAIYVFSSFEKKMEAITMKGSPEVLYLLDGRRTLTEVVRVSGKNRVDVYRLLAELEDEEAVRCLAADELMA
ncbi:DUF4388 domain-containing protein [Planctomycetota bacterium]